MLVYQQKFKAIAQLIASKAMIGVPEWEKPWRPYREGLHPTWVPYPVPEAIIKRTGVLIQHDTLDEAVFRADNTIHLPCRAAFPTATSYYSTVFHELGHWTGTQLERPSLFSKLPPMKALEELVAEFCSAYICGLLDIDDVENHAAYIVNQYNGARLTGEFLTQGVRDGAFAALFILGVTVN